MCVCVCVCLKTCGLQSSVWTVGVGLMSCSVTSVTPQKRLRETDRDKQEETVTTRLPSVAGLLR